MNRRPGTELLHPLLNQLKAMEQIQTQTQSAGGRSQTLTQMPNYIKMALIYCRCCGFKEVGKRIWLRLTKDSCSYRIGVIPREDARTRKQSRDRR